jgi:hypothetical protein
MRERRGLYRVLVGKPEGKRPLEHPGIDGRIIVYSIVIDIFIYLVRMKERRGLYRVLVGKTEGKNH